MKKVLLTLIVTMLTCLGAWAQEPSIELLGYDSGIGTSTQLTPLVLDVNNTSGLKVWVKVNNVPNWLLKVEGNSYVNAEYNSNWDWNNDFQAGAYFTITPNGNGKDDKVTVKLTDYSSNVLATADLWVNVADATLATSLVAPTEAVTVAPGYSVDVPFTFAPSTAVLTCEEVAGGSSNITYTFSNNVLTVTASASAVPNTDAKSFKITPKAGSEASAITIPVSVVAPVAVSGITLSPSATEKTIAKGETYAVSASVTPSDAANKAFSWNIDDDNYKYNEYISFKNGIVTGKKRGNNVVLTATSEEGGYTASVAITVTEPFEGTLNVPTSPRVGADGLKATLNFTNGATEEDYTVVYSSNNTNAVEVNASTGALTLKAQGDAKITAVLTPTATGEAKGFTGATFESATITVGAAITPTWTGDIANKTIVLGSVNHQTSDYPQVSWSDEVSGAQTIYTVEADNDEFVYAQYGTFENNYGLSLCAKKPGTTNVTIKAEYGYYNWTTGSGEWVPITSSTYGPIEVTVSALTGEITLSPSGDLPADVTISPSGDLTMDVAAANTTLNVSANWSDASGYLELDAVSSMSSVANATKNGNTQIIIHPSAVGETTVTVTSIWKKDVHNPVAFTASQEITKTFNVTVTDKSLVTSLTAPANQSIERGKSTEIPVSFAPSTAEFQAPTSDYNKVTVAYKGDDDNKNYGVLVVTAAADAELEHVANITLTPKATSTAAPVTFQVTVAKPKLPVSDVRPKSIFYVGEEYETELVMGGGLTLNNDYTQEYAASNNVAKNDASKAAISLDPATGKIVALNVGTAHIQSTFTPVNSAANEYDVWSNGMDIVVLPGKYSLDIDVNNHNIEKSDVTATTTLKAPVIKLNGKVQTYDASKYDIEYSVAPTYPGVSIEGNTVSITSAAEIGAATIKAVLTPKGGDADNYEGFTAYTQINIEPKSTDKHGIAVTVEDGVLKIKSDYAGAYGTLVYENYVTTITPTIDLSSCSGITGTGAEGALTNDDVINAIKAANKIEIEGLIKNTDMQIFSSWVGGSGSNLIDLNMGEATLAEAVTTNADGNDYVANISFVQPALRQGNNNQLVNLKKLALPHPAAGQTVLPAMFGQKWLGARESTNAFEELVVSDGWTEIGASAFDNQGVTKISLPNSLLYIREAAFFGHHMHQLFLPPNVDVIESRAFSNDPSSFEDVFFTGRTAPTIVDTDAFSSATQCANNAIDKGQATAEGTITRNAYKSGSNYTCMMHYPGGLTKEELATYVDPKRVYDATERTKMVGDKSGNGCAYSPWTAEFWEVIKGAGKGSYSFANLQVYDGKIEAAYLDPVFGTVLTWPSQEQQVASYAIAGSGYHWDGTPFNAAEMSRQGIYQFVLARGDASPDNHDYIFERDYTAGLWWSICVPFNMPVEDIKKVFGDDTKVVRFSKVIRDADAEEKYLRLEFTNSVMGDNNTLSTGNHDGSTGILAHRPYMIKPSLDLAGVNPEESDYACIENGVLRRVYPNYDWVTGALIEDKIEAVKKNGASTGIEYIFKGNHSELNNQGKEVLMPQYSYFLSALKGDEANHQFFFQKGEKGRFHAHTAIVFTADGAQDAEDFFTTTSGAPIFKSVFGDVEDDATDIEKVELVFGNEKFTENVKVYTINGQLVNGSNLAPGLYIKNGKKFIVK